MGAVTSPAIGSFFANPFIPRTGKTASWRKYYCASRRWSRWTEWCVEFGALDEIRFSNTYDLIKHKNYRAVFDF